MPNDIKLQEGHPVDENLRPIKVGGKSTALELAQNGNGARITGGLEVTGDIALDSDDNITLESDNDIILDATSSSGLTGILIKNEGTLIGDITTHHFATQFRLYENGGSSINDYGIFKVATGGATTIETTDGAGSNANILLDADGTIILDSATGNFVLKNNATEFSPTNSSYAGMILGYTDIGLDEAHTTLALTLAPSGLIIPTNEFKVAFVIPPSGNVLIEFQIQYDSGSNGLGTLVAGLSTTDKDTGYTELADFHQKTFDDISSRNGAITVNGSWTLTGLTAGDSEELWIGFASGSTSGSPNIQWGSDASNRYPDFIMKATALPATIAT